ncbi:MAG: hypothetical protein RQ761_05935 [Bacteroidales bacterium]|nr:hypothetical protein [Bacteroidales bacterium]
MEDYIYILIGVIWLAATVYRASQKNKKQAASPKPDDQQSRPQKGMSEAKSLLEELLGGQDVRIPEPEEQEITYSEPEPALTEKKQPTPGFASEYTQLGVKGIKALKEEGMLSKDRILFTDEMKLYRQKKAGQNKINLRKAIIYSTILESPYT